VLSDLACPKSSIPPTLSPPCRMSCVMSCVAECSATTGFGPLTFLARKMFHERQSIAATQHRSAPSPTPLSAHGCSSRLPFDRTRGGL
jgi:hypothetical protein